ncbi:hypothetical protein AK812_SmicGene40269 [Symbiodinium microadriaticum]|uniref:Uncharacterized protein n=1 Tax=Symbiodinium microadriaticum TaxID=2951 RepID=A0A1Q9C912_SYMMI|nr:hypothetical protein AK812_SmicGene40269 [Symbiodinium microadriaticum]
MRHASATATPSTKFWVIPLLVYFKEPVENPVPAPNPVTSPSSDKTTEAALEESAPLSPSPADTAPPASVALPAEGESASGASSPPPEAWAAIMSFLDRAQEARQSALASLPTSDLIRLTLEASATALGRLSWYEGTPVSVSGDPIRNPPPGRLVLRAAPVAKEPPPKATVPSPSQETTQVKEEVSDAAPVPPPNTSDAPQDLVAIVAADAAGDAPGPPPPASAPLPACTSAGPGLPPTLPPSLADTQPFIVDLENQASSPDVQHSHAAAAQLASFAAPPPCPSHSSTRPLVLQPPSPSVRSLAARSPGRSPGASSASWSMHVPPAPCQTSVALPLPPAPLELKLTASATQSMYLAGSHSSESSASHTDQQYATLLVRWREFLSELGSASALYTEACASQNRDFLLDRAARKFAPSTLLRYFDAWLNWSSFCRLAEAAPHDPPPGPLPDWLKSQSSRQGLATMQLRALAWFVKTAGLPKLKVCLCTPICQAFAVASNPQEHRESLPLSLSFVLHLEKSVLDPLSSPAEILRLGYLLLCIWGSLRWGDALWCPPARLHYQPQSHALVGICLRTKTTKRGMPFGVLAAGLSGTTSQCWSLRFLSVLRQSVADTLAINPHRHLDFLPSALSGSEVRPILSAPLKRERMVLWLRGLLLKHWRLFLKHWRLFSQDPAPAAFGLVAAHSLKCTVLSWARQLHLDSDLRRIQGHHRQSGSDRSVSLYSRDDILPMLRLQRLVVDAVRSGFRPLQPMARGLSERFLLAPACLPIVPSASPTGPQEVAATADSDAALESLSSESSDSSAEEAILPDETATTPAPKAVSPPPSASVTAFGYLWNARSNVVQVAMRTEPSATRSKSFLLDGATVWLRPLCGARTHQLDPDSFCEKAPEVQVFVLPLAMAEQANHDLPDGFFLTEEEEAALAAAEAAADAAPSVPGSAMSDTLPSPGGAWDTSVVAPADTMTPAVGPESGSGSSTGWAPPGDLYQPHYSGTGNQWSGYASAYPAVPMPSVLVRPGASDGQLLDGLSLLAPDIRQRLLTILHALEHSQVVLFPFGYLVPARHVRPTSVGRSGGTGGMLDQLSASPAARTALSIKGFASLGSLAFAVSAVSDADEVRLFLRSTLSLADTDDAALVSADSSCIRRLLFEASAAAPPKPALGTTALPPAPAASASSSKIAVPDLLHLRKNFLAKYPGELLTPDSAPSVDFLSLLKNHHDSQQSLWVPWRLRTSESDATRRHDLATTVNCSGLCWTRMLNLHPLRL